MNFIQELFNFVSHALTNNVHAFIITLLIILSGVLWRKCKSLETKNDSIQQLNQDNLANLQFQKDKMVEDLHLAKDTVYQEMYGESRENSILVLEALKATRKALEEYVRTQHSYNKDVTDKIEALKDFITDCIRDLKNDLK